MKQRVIILGSTGSIGTSTLSVIREWSDDFEVVGLAACSSWQSLAAQAEEFGVRHIAIHDADASRALDGRLPGGSELYVGPGAMTELVANVACDCVVAAVVGADGLPATLEAAARGRRIALANKEALVIAGAVLMPMVERHGCEIIPIDSEHSAIFQALRAGRLEEVRRICLTASGGPFRTWSREALARATVKDALNHPTWDMGPKISIDSATMMNKALEIVEAHWLFDLPSERIDVVVHPECIVHSWVEFCDGSIIAQMGAPDMRTPIQYALAYPHRRPGPSEALDLAMMRELHFEPPDLSRFGAIELGHAAAARGGTCGAVLNAANEAAVDLFRSGAIAFTDITQHVETALRQHECVASPGLDDLVAADQWARTEVARCQC